MVIDNISTEEIRLLRDQAVKGVGASQQILGSLGETRENARISNAQLGSAIDQNHRALKSLASARAYADSVGQRIADTGA